MPFVDIPADAWTAVTTTAGSTIVQNRGAGPLYVTGESTASRDRDEGIQLDANVSSGTLYLNTGVTLSAYSVGRPGRVYYEEIDIA